MQLARRYFERRGLLLVVYFLDFLFQIVILKQSLTIQEPSQEEISKKLQSETTKNALIL